MDLTIGPLRAPEVAYDQTTGGFWLTWTSGRTSLDIVIADVAQLRALVRACLEAAPEAGRENAVTNAG